MTKKQNLEEKLLADYNGNLSHSGVSGKRLAARLQALSEIGLTAEGGSYRIGFSEEERKAKSLVKRWMEEAGLTTKIDGAGNVFGRLDGIENERQAILSGSHLDTVPNGGHFDGTIGVLSALEAVEAWKETGYKPKKPFEVVIYSDEEGSRFNGGLTGSQALVGDLDIEEQKQLKDIDGVPFEEVMKQNGLSLKSLAAARRHPDEIGTFAEVHIEQGKRLEKADQPVGIVTGIAGPCWIRFVFKGTAGHAGNTPMNDRQDALVAAGEFVAQVNTLPGEFSPSAVATVGKLNVHPNGVNVIPGKVELFVDIRDIHEESRDALVERVVETAEQTAEKYDVNLDFEKTLKVQPVPIREEMQQRLAESLRKQGLTPQYMPSGAGHDAMNIGRHAPIAMLFIRSKDGVSHNPAEWSSLDDCVQGVHVLKDFLETLIEED